MKKLKAFLCKYKWFNLLINDYHVRTIVFSCCSFGFGLLYAVYNGIIAIISHSPWLGAMACYYLFLDILRGVILLRKYRRVKKVENKVDEDDFIYEIKEYRNCGIVFLFVIICLSAITTQIVSSQKSFAYAEMMIYITAGYTFWKIGMAIYNTFKAEKHREYITRILRSINLVSALGSFLTLQAVALYTYSTTLNIKLANMITGSTVCVLIFFIGIYLIVNGTEELKKLSKE